MIGLVGTETIDLFGASILAHWQTRVDEALTRAAVKYNGYCSFADLGVSYWGNKIANNLFDTRLILVEAYCQHPSSTISLWTPNYKIATNLFLDLTDLVIVAKHGGGKHGRIDYILASGKPILLLEAYQKEQWVNLNG